MYGKNALLLTVTTVALLFMFTASATPVLVADNIDNANYVTENELENALSGIRENISNRMSGVQNDVGDLSDQIAGLENTISEYVEEEKTKTGESLYVMALGENDYEFLNFGGMGMTGTQNPLMQRQTTGGGGGFSIPKVSPDSLIAVVDDSFGVVDGASISLFYRGENGGPVMNPNYPMSGGYTWFPRTAGMISGTVTAPGYKEASFFVRTGKVEEEGGPAKFDSIAQGSPFKVNEMAIVKAVDADRNNMNDVSLEVIDPDGEGAGPRKSPLNFAINSDRFTVIATKGGEQIGQHTFTVTEGTSGGESGNTLEIVAVAIVIVIGLFITSEKLGWTSFLQRFRRSKSEKL